MDGHYLALRRSQATLYTDSENLNDWMRFFLVQAPLELSGFKSGLGRLFHQFIKHLLKESRGVAANELTRFCFSVE